MIPKKIHMIWIGTKPFPYKENLKSYKKLNPGWEVKLWTDKNIPTLRNQKVYDEIPILATKSDILRLEILLKHGGVFVDADSTCLKPLDPLFTDEKCFFSTNYKGKIEINFMGCEAKNATMAYLVKRLRRYWNRKIQKETFFNVYFIYRFIRKKVAHLEFTKIERAVNCTEKEMTSGTYILQGMHHTWGENKWFEREAATDD